jgi:hypothetical protein
MIHVDYSDYLKTKELRAAPKGFAPLFMPDYLMPFQASLVDWAIRLGRAALFEECGLGKTIQQLVWAENILRKHPKSRVLIVTPLAVSGQTVREAEKFGIKATQTQEGKLYPGINVTNYDRLKNYRPEDFIGAVGDECFPAGTQVDTVAIDNSLALKYIEDIRPGDRILNASGVDCVKATAKRRVHCAVVLRIRGKEITCSENHPFFTVHGWVGARDLRAGDRIVETAETMRLVRQDIHPEVSGEQIRSFLREILLGEMANEYAGTQTEGAHERSSREDWTQGVRVAARREQVSEETNRTNPQSESYEQSEVRREDDRHEDTQRDIATVERETRGQWDGTDGAGENAYRRPRTRVEARGSSHREQGGERVSDVLQDRLREREAENRDRGGRVFTQLTEKSRREEGRETSTARVESVEILQQDDPRLDKFREADGSLYFYDLEAVRHPSFSVSGLLVHNSSIIKNFEGQTRKRTTQFFSKVNYRLLCTATPAPNDFMELGTSSEALGSMTRSQMLAMFFTNGGDSTQDWEIKGHARRKFWQWVSTWARAVRKPSDLGFEDGDFNLPPLNIHKHEVPSTLDYGKGGFFKTPARTLEDQRKERKDTLKARCEKVASLVPDKGSAIIWCHLNNEGNLLTKLIPDAVEVCGADKDSVKEDRLLGFSDGKYRVLVTKPKIAGFGLNWQHCRNVFYFPNHSHEQYYQAIRRCWRFGQKKPVECHLISSEAETLVVQNMLRKEKQSEILYAGIVQEINTAVHEDNKKAMNKMEIPSWL